MTYYDDISDIIWLFPDINNKDVRDANNPLSDSDDEGESMDWWSKYFASLDKMISVGFYFLRQEKYLKC